MPFTRKSRKPRLDPFALSAAAALACVTEATVVHAQTSRAAPGQAVREPVRTAHVRFEGMGFAFYERPIGPPAKGTSAAVYRRLCIAPCSLDLAPGRHDLAVAPDSESAPVEKRVIELPEGASTLRGEYYPRTELRIAGAATIALSLLLSGALVASTDDTGEVLWASAIAISGVSLGAVLMLAPDAGDLILCPPKPRAR
jgi:hypothetical protein